MMRSRLLLIVIAVLIAPLGFPALAQPAGRAPSATDPAAFVRGTYGRYSLKSATGPDFTGRNASSVFSPSLVQLIRRDQKQARGEVGKLDGDPICDCQDPDGLKLSSVLIADNTGHAAVAAVTLLFPPNSVTHLRLRLVLLPEGWRVDDVETTDMPSLRKLLQSR